MAHRYHPCHLLWLVVFLLVSFSIADDGAIMAKLSNSMSNPSTWNGDDFCKWEGITCDKSRRVISISLPFKSLNGTLPSDLNSLTQLKTLDLQSNKLSGALPTLANLTFLQIVFLNDNYFTSVPVDFFLGLTNLQSFSISNNFDLESWILPNELTRCNSLRTFHAMEANISGPIPHNFSSLTNLEELILYHNQLNGSLPADLNNLSKLTTIDLARNFLSGALPTFANLTLLQDVSLHENYFTSIPDDFFLGLASLQEFSIFYNLLEPWALPKELAQCTKLRRIYAADASISGPVPDIFNSLLDLQELSLSGNSLTGTLPSSLKKLSQIKSFDFDGNSLSGPLPTLANLTVLEQVRLNDNNFSSIPLDFFLGLPNLREFNISNSSGLEPWFLPNDLKESTRLETFSAMNANIIGSIPDIFNTAIRLSVLRLSYNNLTGTLPATFGGSPIANLWLDNQLQGLSGTLDVLSSMTQLRQAFLHANAFTGAIPDLSNCTNLNELQLDDNQLTGLVPNSLFSLKNLARITLQNNSLQGQIPVFKAHVNSSIGINSNSYCLPLRGECDPKVTALLEVAAALGYPMSLAKSWRGNDACKDWNFVACDSSGKDVTVVNFGKQKFSGTISPSFANLTSLRNLSLNENNLTGPIPQNLASLRDLQLLNVSNNNLFGEIPEFPQKVKFLHDNNPLLRKHNSSKNNVSVGVIISIVIASVLSFIGIVLLVFYKCYRLPRRSQITENHGEIPISESGNNVIISIQLLEQVTDSFSDNNVLGRGGFGTVYKGELKDGTKIAVKKMKSDVNGTKEFHAEIGVLTKVRHKHLVALLGYCINDNERLLVYEYMPQGTLSQHLFKWREHSSQPLSWKQRVSIALDVGRGVEYLHSLAQQSFIHRDLKPGNILLDDDMRAKVADFGLVKHAPDHGKYSMDTRLAGTFGYLAPEYAATGRVTTKVDIFAFGVVLMQLITGRKALDGSMPDERCQLVTWFRKVPVCKQNMVKFIDEVLDTDDHDTECILKVAELANHCTASEPFQRPNMGYVVGVLAHLVQEWNPSRHQEDQTYGHKHHTSLPGMFLDGEDTSTMLNLFRSTSF